MFKTTSYRTQLKALPKLLGKAYLSYWRKSRWSKAVIIILATGFVLLASMYGVARWYMSTQASKPLTIGTTFIPAYAQSLGVEPQQTMDALLTDLNVKHLRLVSYWDQLEPQDGVYDFKPLDWQFQKAEIAGAKVSLSLGLRQPRWPECHMPTWAATMPPEQWQPKLNNFIEAVVSRYKHSPALESYQLENEYFLKGFGLCTDFSRDRLIAEYDTVKRTDPSHPVIVTRSNNAIGTPLGKPTPDIFGVSIYKRVWSMPIGRYLEYPFPAWYYGFLAGVQKITTGKDMIIHELQAETWPPNGQGITDTSLEEQNKSIDAKRFADRIEYGKGTGIRTMYLWGSEYWYYRKVKLNDPSLWNVAKDAYRTSQR